jgi:cell division protein ZapA (FtsZ GTPase activity inhibitor)
MVTLQIAIGRNKYEISCRDEERDGIMALASNLNKRVNLVAMSIGRLSDVVVLFLTAVTIQREIDRAKKVKQSTFNDYLLDASKRINSIFVADANLGDKEERDRLFISCLNLENELKALGGGVDSDDEVLTEEEGVRRVIPIQSTTNLAQTASNTSSAFTSEEELEDVLNVFEELTNQVNTLAIKLNRS